MKAITDEETGKANKQTPNSITKGSNEDHTLHLSIGRNYAVWQCQVLLGIQRNRDSHAVGGLWKRA